MHPLYFSMYRQHLLNSWETPTYSALTFTSLFLLFPSRVLDLQSQHCIPEMAEKDQATLSQTNGHDTYSEKPDKPELEDGIDGQAALPSMSRHIHALEVHVPRNS